MKCLHFAYPLHLLGTQDINLDYLCLQDPNMALLVKERFEGEDRLVVMVTF